MLHDQLTASVIAIAGWALVFALSSRPPKVVGKIATCILIFNVFALAIMLVRGLSLPSAMNGMFYVFFPDFNKVGRFEVCMVTLFRNFTDCLTGLFAETFS